MMAQFLKLGDLWINAEQITEVHVEFSTSGTPTSCKLKLLGEAVREPSGEEITGKVVAFLQANEYNSKDSQIRK
jgi:hypothetical protein